jgi:diguanylate cyclase (GGDEF)-like protein
MWSSSLFRDTAVPLLLVEPAGRIAMANPAGLALLGRHSLSGVDLAELVAAQDRVRLAAFLAACRSLPTGQDAALESIELQTAAGWRFVRIVGSRSTGEAGRPVLWLSPQVLVDRGGPAAVEGHDLLTAVASRAVGLEALGRAVGPGAPGCLLLVDIDDFDAFNQAHGVALGDQVLVEVAARMLGAVPPGATVARIDGDQFLVVAGQTPVGRVAELGRMVLSAVSEPMDVAGTRVVTASIGAASLAATDPDEALARAGQALEAAQAQGGSQLVLEGPGSLTFGRRRRDLMAAVKAMEVNIKALQSDAESARSQARTDPLTGLPNTLRYQEDLTQLQARARRTGAPIAVLFIDLDEFGLVNKAFGQSRGDHTLVAVATLLESACRGGDVVYRVGGEEFVALLPDCDLPGACAAAERVRATVEAARIPHGARDGLAVVTLSIGAAAGQGPAVDLAGVARTANRQMRMAKAGGRNCVLPRLEPPAGVA